MKKRQLQDLASRTDYRFETPLPAELAMARIHDLLPRELTGFLQQPLYQVSSEALDDSIYFEVRALQVRRGLDDAYVRVARGQIREVDSETTLIDCDVPGEGNLAAGAAIAVLVSLACSLLFGALNEAPFEHILLVWALIGLLVAAGYLLRKHVARANTGTRQHRAQHPAARGRPQSDRAPQTQGRRLNHHDRANQTNQASALALPL